MKMNSSKKVKVLTLDQLAQLVRQGSTAVEDLARSVAAGFSSVHEKIDTVHEKIMHLATKDELRATAHRLEGKMEEVNFKIGHHVTSWDKDLSKVVDIVQELERRVNILEDQMVK